MNTEVKKIEGLNHIIPLKLKVYKWEPLPDITTYELAQAIPAILTLNDLFTEYIIEDLPRDVRRHFKQVEISK